MSMYLKSKADKVEGFLYKSHYGDSETPAHKDLPRWKRLARAIVRITIVAAVIGGSLLALTTIGVVWYLVTMTIYGLIGPSLLPTEVFTTEGVGLICAILALLIFIPLIWGFIWEYKD